jgi:hypothetical protein
VRREVIVLRQSQHSSLQRAGFILRETCGDLIVSKQKLKQAERIQLVRQKPGSSNSELMLQFSAVRALRPSRPQAAE